MTLRLLTRLFALFGMTLTCVACYGVEYQEYDPSFAASGRVVDEEGNPIQGIREARPRDIYRRYGWLLRLRQVATPRVRGC